MRVTDTMVSLMCEDGHMRGYSVIGEVASEHHAAGSVSGLIVIMRIWGDPTQAVTRMNPVASSLLGVSGREAGLRFRDFLSPRDEGKVQDAVNRAYQDGHSGAVDTCSIMTVDGKTLECCLWVERVSLGDTVEGSEFVIKFRPETGHKAHNEENPLLSRLLFSHFAEDVFEVNREKKYIKHICHNGRGLVDMMLNVRAYADDFFDEFVACVALGDRTPVHDFCLRAYKGDQALSASERIEFGMINDRGNLLAAVMTVIPVSDAKFFLCLDADYSVIEAESGWGERSARRKVSARLFGAFSLSVNGRGVHIRSEKKAKELLALLIQRHGAFFGAKEAISALWECDVDEKSRARYRKTVSRLMAELRRVGVDYIIESDRGAHRIVPEYIDCDYYEYLEGELHPTEDLLPEYSWSEYIRVD